MDMLNFRLCKSQGMHFRSLLLLFIPFIFGCQDTSSKYEPREDLNGEIIQYIGKWRTPKYLPHPFSAGLILHPNGTFEYGVGACLYSGEGYGYWIFENNGVTLYSHVEYSCKHETPFDGDCKLIDNDKPEYSSSHSTCPHPDQYIDGYIIFNQVHFRIVSDTLWNIDSNKINCPDMSARFVKYE